MLLETGKAYLLVVNTKLGEEEFQMKSIISPIKKDGNNINFLSLMVNSENEGWEEDNTKVAYSIDYLKKHSIEEIELAKKENLKDINGDTLIKGESYSMYKKGLKDSKIVNFNGISEYGLFEFEVLIKGNKKLYYNNEMLEEELLKFVSL